MQAQRGNQTTNMPKRDRSRVFVLSSLLLLAAAYCIWSYITVSHSRYRVIGKTDPKTGYHIEYTVSSQYRKSISKRLKGTAPYEELDFAPGQPPPALRWIYTNILRRPPDSVFPALPGIANRTIEQTTWNSATPEGTTIDSQGYIEITGVSGIGKVTNREHVLVTGCRATWLTIDLPGALPKNKALKICAMLIRPAGEAVSYAFVGFSDGSQASGDVQREMNAIRDSMLIVKSRQSAVGIRK